MANNKLTCRQIREEFARLIASVVTTPKVYSFNALDPDIQKWKGVFKYGTDSFHGWIMTRSLRDATIRSAIGCNDYEWDYHIWGFYGFRPGNNVSNSDDEFSAIVDAVADKFNETSFWYISNGTRDVSLSHEGLKFPALTTLNCGGSDRLHWAAGKIRIRWKT